ASLGEDCLEKIKLKEKAVREKELRLSLLPQARPAPALPVWRQAKFSAKAGLSLPPYLAEGARDAELAGHVARFGDVEAGRRLVAPGDAALSRVNSLALERNYPLEWTRLVALLLHDAQIGLAAGELEGARRLVGLHKQLQQVLGTKARTSPLGS